MLLKEIRQNYKRPVSDDAEYGIDAGRYVGMHFTPDTQELLKKIIHDEAVPNAVPCEKMHTTITYSKDNSVPDYQCDGELEEPIEAEIDSFDLFPTAEGKKCLVAKLNCPEFHKRHNLMRDLGASYDYDEYIPHITLSYNAGDLSADKLEMLNKKYRGMRVYANEEYDEPIKNNWAKDL